MKLTCEQMDVLISFYIDNELNKNMKSAVEEHLKVCFSCKTKYEIIKSLSDDITKKFARVEEFTYNTKLKSESDTKTPEYNLFKKNLSAYIDNELSEKDSLKIKKIAINNKIARKDLENSYKLKHLINNSARKTKSYIKQDFSKKILSLLQPGCKNQLLFSDMFKLISGFLTSVIVISLIVIISLN